METVTDQITKTVDVRCPGEFFVNSFNNETKTYGRIKTACNKFLLRIYYSAISGQEAKVGIDIKCPRCKEKFERIEVI